MNALTLPDLLQPLEQDGPDSFPAQATRPKFTRAKRTSDLRTAFRPASFETAGLVVQEVRHGVTHDPAGGVAIAEIVASVGELQFRSYIHPNGELLIPEILRTRGLEARLTALLAAAGECTP